MVRKLLTLIVTLGLILSITGTALAQSEGRLALGASFGATQAPGGDSNGSVGYGFVYRFGHSREGWKYKYSLNWYTAALGRTIGGSRANFGRLRVVPVMGGYGYTHLIGTRTTVSANMMAGYAFTKFSVDEAARNAFRSTTGSDRLETNVRNTFVLRPEVSTWFDVNRKLGLNLNVGYVVARPKFGLVTEHGVEQRRMNVDMLSVRIGFAYSVF